jgi:LPS O-antigen subunit length determinant protein (WzzB/FepE family)
MRWRLCGMERIIEVDATENSFHWKVKIRWANVKRSSHIQRRWQNILIKLPGVISQARKATISFEAWNCFITDEISDKIAQHANHYIQFIETNFSPENAAKFTNKIDIKTLIDLLCLAGALRNNSRVRTAVRSWRGWRSNISILLNQ